MRYLKRLEQYKYNIQYTLNTNNDKANALNKKKKLYKNEKVVQL